MTSQAATAACIHFSLHLTAATLTEPARSSMQAVKTNSAAAGLFCLAVSALLILFSSVTVPISSWTKETYRYNMSQNLYKNYKPVDIVKKKNVYFLKVHKTGSTTFGLLLKRFVLKSNLSMPFFKWVHAYPPRDMIK